MKIGNNIRTQPVQSAYPVSGVEPCGAAANDADVERLCRGGGEAPRQALDKQRPQPHHRAGEEPQTAGHGGSAGDHTTGSRIWTQAGHGAGDLEDRLPGGGEVAPHRFPLSRRRPGAAPGRGRAVGCGLVGDRASKTLFRRLPNGASGPISLARSLRGLDRANFP